MSRNDPNAVLPDRRGQSPEIGEQLLRMRTLACRCDGSSYRAGEEQNQKGSRNMRATPHAKRSSSLAMQRLIPN